MKDLSLDFSLKIHRINSFLKNLPMEPSLIEDNDLTEVNNSYNIFSNNYLNLYNKYFPYVRMSRKSFKNKPYITSAIKVSIKHKNKLHKCYINNPTPENKNKYSSYRNKLTHIIRKSKCRHYTEQLNLAQGDGKKLWKVLKGVPWFGEQIGVKLL